MFKNLNVFKMAHAMATHAGARQAVVAQNIAHADTPGYRAKDIVPFSQLYEKREVFAGQHATRKTHLLGTRDVSAQIIVSEKAGSDPNENSVSIEEQMLNAVEVKRQHDRAVSIYKSALGILRTSIRHQ
ncbi:FlgB family protein [Thalassococcus sp. S3]|uniref:FlgB family protein n=1 Tax=Thalassococcus sp. S3 TaxID=2017482 RepID=UPI0010244D55|nr:FlgB family protein [Thalassococcus sp. S3]QBF29708.1 hypothetical protein CFI11_00565 [Thalassococcus sp. S3]